MKLILCVTIKVKKLPSERKINIQKFKKKCEINNLCFQPLPKDKLYSRSSSYRSRNEVNLH